MSKELASPKEGFRDILDIIENARLNAYRAVNKELIHMYWAVGEYVSKRVEAGVWGKGTVNEISKYILQHNPGASGFSPQNLRRMRQFYETYKDDAICSALLSEIGWANHIAIMTAKTAEERTFYLMLTSKNKYSNRELQRQMDSCLYERTMLSKNFDANALLAEGHEGVTALRDSYVLEFLDMPADYKEKDLRKAIVSNLKEFILEFGKDFSFIGEVYRIQVGNSDFFIDLVFYNRELKCLVAIESKTGAFKPDHVGQMMLYLEALDRDVRKEGENLSVGLILCSDKDDAVVEYTMAKSLTPSPIAAYELALPDKRLLRQRVKEIAQFADEGDIPDRT